MKVLKNTRTFLVINTLDSLLGKIYWVKILHYSNQINLKYLTFVYSYGKLKLTIMIEGEK